nr:hypothetical protein [candidate division Zixibacteria bacterium]
MQFVIIIPSFITIMLLTGIFPSMATVLDSGSVNLCKMPLNYFNINITKIDQPPIIDGVLSDPCWTRSASYNIQAQNSPDMEAPATESTICYYAYDSQNLYFAARCYDSEPDKVVANLRRREDIGEDDFLFFSFDTYNDKKSSFYFIINPLGVQADGNQWATGSDESWDGVWTSAGKLTEFGWQIEAAIPFKTLRFPNQDTLIWRTQILRFIKRKNEMDAYVPFRKTDNNQMERMAEIHGLSSIGGDMILNITPYITNRYDDFPDNNDKYNEFNGGADIKYGPAPNIIFDATINPDFGQVEADYDYINLTPYEFYLQEKRPFFLEMVELFQTPYTLFYSRRIADPDAGIRMTGKIDKFSFAAFYARDNVDYSDSKDNFLVARVEREIMDQSFMGFMVTSVDRPAYNNIVAAGDWNIKMAPLTFSGQLALSDTDTLDGPSGLGQAKISFYRYNINAAYRYSFIEKHFYTAAGYVTPQVVDMYYTPLSYRTHLFSANYEWQINKYSLQTITPSFSTYVRHDYDGRRLMRNYSPYLNINLNRNIGFTFSSSIDEILWENEYFDLYAFGVNLGVNPTGYLGANVYYAEGKALDYWNIRSVWQKEFNLGISWNPIRQLEILPSVSHASQYEYQHGPETYSQWIGLLRIGYQFNKNAFTKIFVQGNDYSDIYVGNFLLGYILSPGSTLYLAYNSNYRDSDDDFSVIDRIIFLKLSYQFRL